MGQPPVYDRATSFTNWQAANPTLPLPASAVDQEFNRVKSTLDGLLNNVKLLQRDDGRLANASVGLEQLSPSTLLGFDEPQAWATGGAYSTPSSMVFHGAGYYRCLVSHSAGDFTADLAAGRWELVVDLSSIPLVAASQIASNATGNVAATNVQAAIAELENEKAPVAHTHLANNISDSTAIGRNVLKAADASAVKSLLGIAGSSISYGDMKWSAAILPDAGWLKCYGQAISRTTYSALFSAITIRQNGTRTNASAIITGLSSTADMKAGMAVSGVGVQSGATIASVDSSTQITLSSTCTSSGTSPVVVAPYGVGDGSTTFNMPDGRGRALVAPDNFGGSAASRWAAATRMGYAGGESTHTLTEAELPTITPAGTVSTVITQNAKHFPNGGGGASSGAGFNAQDTNGAGDATITAASTFSGTPFGSGTAHTNVQPSLAANLFIYAGV